MNESFANIDDEEKEASDNSDENTATITVETKATLVTEINEEDKVTEVKELSKEEVKDSSTDSSSDNDEKDQDIEIKFRIDKEEKNEDVKAVDDPAIIQPPPSIEWSSPDPPSGFKDQESLNPNANLSDENVPIIVEKNENKDKIEPSSNSSHVEPVQFDLNEKVPKLKDSSTSSDSSDQEESDEMTRIEEKAAYVPVMKGPMKFSIDSYDSRQQKETPYSKKIIRTESTSGGQIQEPKITKKPKKSKQEKIEKESLKEEQETKSLIIQSDLVKEQKITQNYAKNESHSMPNFTDIRSKSGFENEVVILRRTKPKSLVTPMLSSSDSEDDKKSNVKKVKAKRPQIPDRNSKPQIKESDLKIQTVKKSSEESGQNSRNPHILNKPWTVRKTSLQSNRVLPNDDLALNLKRKSSFSNAASTQTPGLLNSNMSKAKSMGQNMDKVGDDIREIEVTLRSINNEGERTFLLHPGPGTK